MTTLDQFILLCRAEPAASCRVRDFCVAFRVHVGPAEARKWPRGRVAARLASGSPLVCGGAR